MKKNIRWNEKRGKGSYFDPELIHFSSTITGFDDELLFAKEATPLPLFENKQKGMRPKVTGFELWLLSQRWLWKRVIFDNGIVGKNYVRYDHRLLSYCEGMGVNGVFGTKKDAIKNCLNSIQS